MNTFKLPSLKTLNPNEPEAPVALVVPEPESDVGWWSWNLIHHWYYPEFWFFSFTTGRRRQSRIKWWKWGCCGSWPYRSCRRNFFLSWFFFLFHFILFLIPSHLRYVLPLWSTLPCIHLSDVLLLPFIFPLSSSLPARYLKDVPVLPVMLFFVPQIQVDRALRHSIHLHSLWNGPRQINKPA